MGEYVKYVSLFVFILPLLIFSYPHVDLEVTQWYGNADCALSITFDDCSENQYLLAYPIMETYGIRGSFGVVTSWVGNSVEEPEGVIVQRMSWEQIDDLHEEGNEISSHSDSHKMLTELSGEDLLSEIQKSKRIIEEQTGSPCTTMHFPYSQTDESVKHLLRDSGYRCARTLDSALTPAPDLYEIPSYAIFDDVHPSLEDLEEAIGEARKKGGWLVITYHHIDEHPDTYSGGSDLPLCLTPETFEAQMQLFSSGDYWIAPLGEVAAYVRQRESCTIKVERSFSVITIRVLSEHEIPVTLKITTNWWKVRVEGSLEDGEYLTGGEIFLDVLPNSDINIYRGWG